MEEDSSKILREVASFLLLLYAHYFKDSTIGNALRVMVSFSLDANFIGNKVNILDLENIRLKLFSNSTDEVDEQMSYEDFYAWLREVALFVYDDVEENSRFALHQLLTQYIIPLATKVVTSKVKSTVVLKNGVIDVLSKYDTFLRHWFISVLVAKNSHQNSINFSHTVPMSQTWALVNKPGSLNLISINDIILCFSSAGWCPRFYPKDIYVVIVQHVCPLDARLHGRDDTNERTGTGQSGIVEFDRCNLSFNSFLLIIHGLIEYTFMNTVLTQSDVKDDDDGNLEDVVEMFISTAADNFLQQTLRRFWLSEQSLSNSPQKNKQIQQQQMSSLRQCVTDSLGTSGLVSSNGTASHVVVDGILSLNVSSLMWLVRQTGATTHGQYVFSLHKQDTFRVLTIVELAGTLWDRIATRSKKTIADDPRAVLPITCWPLEDIPDLLLKFFIEVRGHGELDRELKSIADNSLPREYSAALLAELCPAALFAVPLRLPSYLVGLYTLPTVSLINTELSGMLDTISNKCIISDTSNGISTIPNSNNNNNNSPWNVSLDSFIRYCEDSAIIPKLLKKSALLKIIEYVLGYNIDTDADDLLLTNGYLLEILYAIAQVSFSEELTSTIRENEDDVSNSTYKQSGDPIGIFRKFLQYSNPNYVNISVTSNNSQPGNDPRSYEGMESATANNPNDRDKMKGRSTKKNPNASKSTVDNPMYVPMHDGDTSALSTGLIEELACRFEAGLSTGFGLYCPFPSTAMRSDWQRALADIELLLLHCPINDFRLNPWKVGSMFTSALRVLYSANDLQYILSQIFRAFTKYLGITIVELKMFFESICSPSSSNVFILKPSIRVAIADRVLRLMMDESILRLLRSNSELLRWEFCRCAATFRSTNPYATDLVVPIPNSAVLNSRPDDVLISSHAALSWALTMVGISEDRVAIQLDCTLVTAGLVNEFGKVNGYLTFSMFICFAIRCFSDSAFGEATNLTRGRSEEEIFVTTSAVKRMLQKFSDHLSAVQLASGIRLLKPLIGLPGDTSRPYLDAVEAMSITRRMILMFEMKNDSIPAVVDADFSFLPASIPTSQWDAPRFIEFSTMFGLISAVGSSFTAWKAFGYHVRSLYYTSPTKLIEWSEGVVPSLSLKATSEVIISLMDSVAKHFDQTSWALKCEDGSSVGLQNLLIQVVTPSVAAYADYHIANPTGVRMKAKAAAHVLALQDILRYGGDWMMESLKNSRAWILSAYKNLVYSSGDGIVGEPLVSVVSRFLACRGLLRQQVVVNQLKSSLHPRLRKMKVTAVWNPSPDTCADELTVSIVELEEALIRCALVAWHTSGASRGGAFPACFQTTVGPDSDPKTQQVIQRYCNECLGMSDDYGARANNILGLNQQLFGRTAGSWGVDFLIPYLRTLQAHGKIPNPTRPRRELIAGTTNARKMLQPLPLMQEQKYVSTIEIGTIDEQCHEEPFHKVEGHNSPIQSDIQNNDSVSPTRNNVQCSKGALPSAPLSSDAMDSISEVENIPEYSPIPGLSKNRPSASLESPPQSEHFSHALSPDADSVASDSPLFSGLRKESAAQAISYGPILVLTPASTHPKTQVQLTFQPTVPTENDEESAKLVPNTRSDSDRNSSNTALGPHPVQTRKPAPEPALGSAPPSLDRAKAILESEAVIAGRDKFLEDILASRTGFDKGLGSVASNKPAGINDSIDYVDKRKSKQFEQLREDPSDRISNKVFNNQSISLQQAGSTRGVKKNGNGTGTSTSTSNRDAGVNPRSSRRRPMSTLIVPNSKGHTLLDDTREAMWPVYATFCSCGDSSDPGKLSGPNLFALLATLGVLTDETVLADIGMLLHQVSAHSMAQMPIAVAVASSGQDEASDSPSLSFEEFLIFLCAFSHLHYKDTSLTPLSTVRSSQDTLASNDCDANWQDWFNCWVEFMGSSRSFRKLLEDCILPLLRRSPLLASPEDARHRDKYSAVFTLEVLLAVQGVEPSMQASFQKELNRLEPKQPKRSDLLMDHSGSILPSVEPTAMVTLLKRLKLVPQVLSKSDVLKLCADVKPAEIATGDIKDDPNRAVYGPIRRAGMLFPQWEWVICVVSLKAVEVALKEVDETSSKREDIGSLVADVIQSIGEVICM